MANTTGIEWADLTINPIFGCSKCSPGCDNCYAEKFAARLAKNPKTAKRYSRVVTDGKWNGRTNTAFLDCFRGLPVAPKRIFVGSMGDVFHRDISERDIQQLFEYMQVFSKHTFMLLTKRPERMHYLMNLEHNLRKEDDGEGIENRTFREWPLPNVWLGVTVCNQKEADEKIPILLSTPAAKRFVSIEPMLGPVYLQYLHYEAGAVEIDSLNGTHGVIRPHGGINDALDWVICGGETGSGARPMHPYWARSIRDQCVAAGVPFFFKQWGEWWSDYDRDKDDPDWREVPRPRGKNERFINLVGGHGFHGERVVFIRRVGRKNAGCLLDGREWKEVPE